MRDRAPAKHPRTGKPSARIDGGSLYWFGVRIGKVRFDDDEVALEKIGGDTDSFPSKVALLKTYGRRRVHALLAETDEFHVLHLGDNVGSAKAVPGGYVFAGRYFGSLKSVIASAAENRGIPRPPFCELRETGSPLTYEVAVAGKPHGRVDFQLNGQAILRAAGNDRNFPDVGSMLRWLARSYGMSDGEGGANETRRVASA